MCWQCAAWKPDEYLKIFDSFVPHSWFWGGETGDGVFEFSLEGETWHTNPKMEPGSIGQALPGDVDCNGEPVFVSGKFTGKYNSTELGSQDKRQFVYVDNGEGRYVKKYFDY